MGNDCDGGPGPHSSHPSQAALYAAAAVQTAAGNRPSTTGAGAHPPADHVVHARCVHAAQLALPCMTKLRPLAARSASNAGERAARTRSARTHMQTHFQMPPDAVFQCAQ